MDPGHRLRQVARRTARPSRAHRRSRPPRWVSLQRLVRRTFARLIDGRLVCNGNRETLRQILSSDSIIVWHFKSFRRKRQRIRHWMTDPSAPPVHRLSSARHTDQ